VHTDALHDGGYLRGYGGLFGGKDGGEMNAIDALKPILRHWRA
jgi:hypothetical protein